MRYDELPAFAERLRLEGIDAKHDMVDEENQNGIRLYNHDGGSDFFALRTKRSEQPRATRRP